MRLTIILEQSIRSLIIRAKKIGGVYNICIKNGLVQEQKQEGRIPIDIRVMPRSLHSLLCSTDDLTQEGKKTTSSLGLSCRQPQF